MSGVFGFVDNEPGRAIDRVIRAMGTSLAHCPWMVIEEELDPEYPVGLGRVGIGILNQATQPVWNTERSIALVLAGEFYDKAELPPAYRALPDEHLALHMYQEHGATFASHLKGAFVIAVWDRVRRQMILTNDRFALYNLYYALDGKALYFAPEVKSILSDTALKRKLDWTALAQYMRFQHLLGERTFFEGIKLLPPAAVLRFDQVTSTAKIDTYWGFGDIPYQPELNFNEAVNESGRLLRRSVERLSGDQFRPGVFLSGGLDSRTILGMVSRRPVASLTYGHANCRDVYYASRIARVAGSDHYWVDLPDGEWVRQHASFHLDLTEGFHSWIHAHGISALPLARSVMDVNLTGWDGGTVMGHADNIEPLQLQPVDNNALTSHLFTLFNQRFTWPSLTEAEEAMLYCEPLRKELRGLAFDSFREELKPYLHLRPDVRAEYFYLRNHSGRLTHYLVTFTRSHIEVRFPFFDYDLIDFLYSLPAKVRGDQVLYRAMITRETPRLSRIPYDHDEILPTSKDIQRRYYSTVVRLKRRVNRHLGPIFPERHTLYADYENYLRGSLRNWAEEILYDRRTMDRGIFSPSYLHTLMERHMTGREEWTIGKIAPLITYELMLRKFLD